MNVLDRILSPLVATAREMGRQAAAIAERLADLAALHRALLEEARHHFKLKAATTMVYCAACKEEPKEWSGKESDSKPYSYWTAQSYPALDAKCPRCGAANPCFRR